MPEHRSRRYAIRPTAPTHPRLEDADDADIDLDTQELVESGPAEPPGYGYGEWTSGPFRTPRPRQSVEHAPYAGRGPRGYPRSDARIYEDICDRLTVDSHVDASDIDVNVRDGDVTLRGSVPTREMRRRAGDVNV